MLTQIRIILDLQTYRHTMSCTSYLRGYTWLNIVAFNICGLIHAELIPANNSVVLYLPATLSCRVTDTTGTFPLVIPEWYIDGVRAGWPTERYYVMGGVTDAPNNATIIVVQTFVQARATCRIPFYPWPRSQVGVIQCECLVRSCVNWFVWFDGCSSACQRTRISNFW